MVDTVSGDVLFSVLYFPVAMFLAVAGMAWDAVRRLLDRMGVLGR